MGEVFDHAGIEDTKENRKRADMHIREVLGLRREKCGEVWKELKGWLSDGDKRTFLEDKLREAFKE
jgi:hypothetical protein